jgi:hypothetical protein
MKIPIIETDKKKFFLQYLTIINPIALKLRPMQLKVLAMMCYYNNELSIHALPLRNNLLFSPVYKRMIRDAIKDGKDKPMTEGNFNNIIKELRQKGFIVGSMTEATLVPFLNITPEKNNILTINWKIK